MRFKSLQIRAAESQQGPRERPRSAKVARQRPRFYCCFFLSHLGSQVVPMVASHALGDLLLTAPATQGRHSQRGLSRQRVVALAESPFGSVGRFHNSTEGDWETLNCSGLRQTPDFRVRQLDTLSCVLAHLTQGRRMISQAIHCKLSNASFAKLGQTWSTQ